MRKLRPVLLIGGVFAFAAAVFLVTLNRSSRPAQPKAAKAAPTATAVVAPLVEIQRVEVDPNPSKEITQPTSVREALAAYWGSEWPRVQAQMLESGKPLDLDQPFEFVPWEKANPVVEKQIPLTEEARAGLAQAMVLWPDELTSAWLKDECPAVDVPKGGFTSKELEILTEIARPYNDHLLAFGDLWAYDIDSHLLEQFRAGQIEKAPYSTYGLSKERGFYAAAYACSSWSVVIVLKEEDYPDMGKLLGEIREIRSQREVAIAQYVARNARR